jgi:hypothetical protein
MTITINGSGTITGASTLATTVASPTLTTPNINSAQFATVTGTAPIYPCRAWVNFNGTGTVAIRASGNVSSITDNGTGDYTVNFTTAMPDANYAQNVSASFSSGAYAETTIGLNFTSGFAVQAPTTSNFRFCLGYARGNTFIDQAYVTAAVFR